MAAKLVGTTIGSYRLLEQLGAGAMSSVYRAQPTGKHAAANSAAGLPGAEEVAMKVLPLHLAANDVLHHRFLREAYTAARLKHPHILPVYDFGEDDGTPFIVMKLIGGGTLDERLRQRALNLTEALHILRQVAAGLDYAHQQGVIHRDLKPANILFDTSGHAYLSDFGIAHLADTPDALTEHGSFVGTATYAAPEQCRGEEVTPSADIYALGIVLYKMLTGHVPFTGPTPLAVMHRHISEPPPNPLQHRSDLPIGINDVMRKALAKLPQMRFPTAQALSDSLERVIQREMGLGSLTDKAPPIGPNPTFASGDSHTAPAIPDDLLSRLAPHADITRPARPPKVAARISKPRQQPAPAAPEAAASAASTPPQPNKPLNELRSPKPAANPHMPFLVLTALVIMILIALGAALLLLA